MSAELIAIRYSKGFLLANTQPFQVSLKHMFLDSALGLGGDHLILSLFPFVFFNFLLGWCLSTSRGSH